MQATVESPETDFTTATPAKTIASPGVSRMPVRLSLLVLALVSGSLLYLCHFPVAWGWLGWVALVPLLPLLRAETRGCWRYLCAWLGGTAYFWAAISWMTVADTRMIYCWALLSFYCSLFFPVGIYLVRRVERDTRLPLVLTFPVVWTALEFFRSFFGTGFPWYLLAHTQHDVLHIIQIADLGGSFAVSFLIAAANVVLFEGICRLAMVRQWLGLPDVPAGQCCQNYVAQLLCVVVMLGGTLAYGAWRLSQTEFSPGPRVALLQGNLDQRLRIAADRDDDARAEVLARYDQLCLQAARLRPQPDLIVWPETSFPQPWVAAAPVSDLSAAPLATQKALADYQQMVLDAGKYCETNVLLGLNTQILDGALQKTVGKYNSALLIDGKGKYVMRYDKIHRVPFGEYIPFRDWLPFVDALSPYHDGGEYSIGQGDSLTRFTLGQYRFGVLVCYEDTDPFMAPNYGVTTTDGPPVDFLVNMSNDGWFNGSSEHEEHLAISRFRAVETRRALVRSVNMGISAVIDGNGRVLAPVKSKPAKGHELWPISPKQSDHKDLPISNWRDYKQAEGIVVVDMPIDSRTSVYAMYGDWLPRSCWVLIGVSLAWGWWRRRLAIRRLALQ